MRSVAKFKRWLLLLGSFYLIALVSLILLLRGVEKERPADLAVSPVTPVQIQPGEPFQVLLEGKGFDSQTRAALTLDETNRQAILHQVPTWGRLENLALSDDIVYLANRFRGLQAIDLKTGGPPRIIDSLPLSGQTWGIVAAEDRAYIVNRTGLLQIVDISLTRSAGMRLLSTLQLDGMALDVSLNGRTAIVANSKAGLQAIDVSDPVLPRLVSILAMPGKPYAVTVSAGKAYVATALGGLQIVDVGDPRRMRIIGALEGKRIFGVAVRNGLAFLAAGREGLLVADVRDSAHPRLLGACDLTGTAIRVTLGDQKAYLATGLGGLQVVDIADATRPHALGTYDLPGSTAAVLAEEKRALAATPDSFFVLDLQTPPHPRSRALYDLSARVADFLLEGDRVYVGGHDKIHILEWAGADRLRHNAVVSARETISAIFKSGDSLYILGHTIVPDQKRILQAISLAGPAAPRISTLLETEGILSSLAIDGSVIYLGDKTGIEWHEMEGDQLRRRDRLEVKGGAKVMEISEDLLFAGGHEGDFHVFSLEAGNNLRWRGSYSLPEHLRAFSGAQAIAIRDNFALVADGRNGLLTFDLKNPSRPALTGALQIDGYVVGVSIDGNRAYVSDSMSGLHVVDIGDPRHPVIVSTLGTASNSRRPAITDGGVLFDYGDSGLVISPLPIELTDLSVENRRSLRLAGRAPELPGTYSLRIFNRWSSDELPGALIVQP